MNLTNALLPRTAWAINFALQRSEQYDDPNSAWHYFSISDGLKGELTKDNEVEYKRVGHDNAKIVLKNIQVSDLSTFEWSQPVVISENNVDRYVNQIRVDAGATYKDVVSHTFSKTTSLEEAAKVGLTLALEASVGYKAGNAGGVEGGVKVTATASAEYSRKWGSSETTTDTVSREVVIQGGEKGWTGQYEATRSLSKISRTIETLPTLEYQIEVWDGDNKIYSWNSFAELLMVLRGEAPTDRDLGKKFYDKPIADSEYRAIFNYQSIEKIRFAAVYDDVNFQRIFVIKDGTDKDIDNYPVDDTTKKERRRRRRRKKKNDL